ncbi:MAG: hypothetical protein KAW52_08635, partial [candidate division Zixibacteria bacterium]|nr:hypothetical protein [candidate division Zixibacteria bacterium]
MKEKQEKESKELTNELKEAKQKEQPKETRTKLIAGCTLAYTIITGLLLVAMVYNVCEQKDFNKKQS